MSGDRKHLRMRGGMSCLSKFFMLIQVGFRVDGDGFKNNNCGIRMP